MQYVSVQKDTLFPPKAVWRAITLLSPTVKSENTYRANILPTTHMHGVNAHTPSSHIPQLGLGMREVRGMPVNHQDHIISSYTLTSRGKIYHSLLPGEGIYS